MTEYTVNNVDYGSFCLCTDGLVTSPFTFPVTPESVGPQGTDNSSA